MEPDRQVEIQLGHMCNNRCVFCVSGQRTAMGEALPLPVEPLLSRVREARASGHRKITLLGGEPTLQPGFMPVVRECVALGFEEIVIFTNGVKTAREAVIDEVTQTGGNFTWRISIQGATKEHHERTTRKPGSFDRIERTMRHLADRGERITVNMCVVQSNYESVDRFPDLLAPYGASQLHLDMIRPLDAGQRSEEELRAMIPRYSDLVGPFTKMVRGFVAGFDVNIGNVPYCIAPELAPWIHHDGSNTETIAIDHDDKLSRPWNKYFVKRRDKIKPDRCTECVFDAHCSGLFETYVHFYGMDELSPITADDLVRVDPDKHFFAFHLRPRVETLSDWDIEEAGVEELHLTWNGDGATTIALRPPAAVGAIARLDDMSLHLLAAGDEADAITGAVRSLFLHLADGHPIVFPPGDDAVRRVGRSIVGRLARLRAAAPFGSLRWIDTRLSDDGHRAELVLVAADGEQATLWLAEDGRRATSGYSVEGADPGRDVVEGLREAIVVLSPPRTHELEAREDSPL